LLLSPSQREGEDLERSPYLSSPPFERGRVYFLFRYRIDWIIQIKKEEIKRED